MLGLTLDILAKRIGLRSANRLSRWENGMATPSVENLFRLSIVFGLKPHELYSSLWDELSLEVIPIWQNSEFQPVENSVEN
jgi:transcriptional regulator with XRE-family HTH domain